MHARELLSQAKIDVAPETYFLVSIDHKTWHGLLEKPELSPRMTAQFMILMDKYEVTMLLDEIDFEVLLPAFDGAKVERGYRLLTFDIELELTAVGFLAEVSRILAEMN
ncbi:MAG: hypothetical protein ACRD43_10150, partial [Pyrinomonadaceae bacterium]